MKYWELIADNLSKADWSWGFIVSADEKLTAFLELEGVTHDDSDRNQTATVWLGLAVSNGPSWMLHVLFNSPACK